MVSVSGFRTHTTHVHDNNQDLSSVQEVSDSFTWLLDDFPPGDSSSVETIPVIDLTDPDIVNRIGHACQTWGVFQITGHGVPVGLIDRLELQGRRFFSLPIDQKLKAARRPGDLSGYGQAPILSYFEKVMWSEGFTMAESPANLACQVWPDDYTEFCDVMEEYKKEMKALASKIMWLMLSSLVICKEDLEWSEPTEELDGSAVLHLNWYPRCPDPSRAIGMVPHTDSTFITILYPSSTAGLQVLQAHTAQAHWVSVDRVPGSLVINVGDLLHILTNGRFRSSLHQALVNQDKPRFSAPFFFGPPKDTLIGPLIKLTDADKGPLYRAVKMDEYLGLKKKHYQNALNLLKLA
ncbi:hypothetical protein AAC387_Pa02g3210 [Persea americana]